MENEAQTKIYTDLIKEIDNFLNECHSLNSAIKDKSINTRLEEKLELLLNYRESFVAKLEFAEPYQKEIKEILGNSSEKRKRARRLLLLLQRRSQQWTELLHAIEIDDDRFIKLYAVASYYAVNPETESSRY